MKIPKCCNKELSVVKFGEKKICLHCSRCWDGTEPHETLEEAIVEWNENKNGK